MSLSKSRFVELFGDPVQNDKCWPIDFCKNLTSKIGSGATPKGGQQSYCSEGISLIRSMNVFNNYFDYTDLAHINEDQAHALDNVIIEEKDVLLNITGASVARCCLAPNDLLPARVNQHVSIIRCKERLLPEFVCSLFTSDKYQKLLLNTARAGGATREALTKQQIENLQIIIPPLEEQRKYIEEVKQLDKSKFLLQKILEKLELLKKSRFVEMFGDINLPNTKWKMTPLGKNATLFNGRAYKQEELLDSGKYKLLRVGNFFSTKDWYYSDLELEADKYCDTGDLLFAWSASFGAKIWDQGKVIYHYHIWKVIPNENYNKEFLCFLLNEKTESLKKQTHGSTMMHLTKIGMEQTLFIVPPISLQNQFVDFIHQIDKSKLVIQKSLEDLVGKS